MSGSLLGIMMLRRGMPDGDILVVDQLKVGVPSNTNNKMELKASSRGLVVKAEDS
jgi:hypothetical protein